MTQKARTRKKSSPMLAMALEPRMVFDAALAVDATAAATTDTTAAQTATATTDPAQTSAATDTTAAVDTTASPTPDAALTATSPVETRREVVFIDGTLDDPTVLALAAQPGMEVYTIGWGENGLARMAEVLGSGAPADAVHVLSHGESGQFRLGNSFLDTSTLGYEQTSLAQIGAALKPGGDILLYGCDIAQGSQGQQFIQELAAATGRDVAASTDATGGNIAGGNWMLEAQTGSIETAALSAPAYSSLLATTSLAGTGGWVPVLKGGNFDPGQDPQAGSADIDLAGDATHAMLYTSYDSKGTSGTADDTLAFRLRIANPGTNFTAVALVGIDADGNGDLDAFVGIDGRNNGGVRIFNPGSGDNFSPSSTSISPLTSNLPLPSGNKGGLYTVTSSNFSYNLVNNSTDPDASGSTANFGAANADKFASFAISFQDLASVLQSQQGITITNSTPLRYVALTLTQNNSINGDIGGINGGNNSNTSWSDLGVMSAAMGAASPVSTDAPAIHTATGTTQAFAAASSFVAVDPNLTVTSASTLSTAKVIVEGYVAGQDYVSWTNSGNVTGAWDSTTGILTFSGSGTAADYQSVLRSVMFKNTSNSSADTSRTFSFSVGTNSLSYAGNGHFYEFVSFNGDWGSAKANAAARSLYGMQGYLATITSAGENQFLTQKLRADAWLGGSDDASEGTWKWMTGPEAGQIFGYTNWSSGEPNNWSSLLVNMSGEDFAQIYASTGAGTWNDVGYTSSNVKGYVVEYGGMVGDPAVHLSASRTVSILGSAPTDIQLSATSRPEGSTGTLATLSATDPNAGDTFTYTLTGGATDIFAISGTSLVLKTGAVLDYESASSYPLTIKVTDQTGRSYDKAFTFTVTNVNERPETAWLTAASLPENSPAGTVVGTIGAFDPDAGDTLTYTLLTGTQYFTLEGDVLKLNDGVVLDYETMKSIPFSFRATDAAGLSNEYGFNINLRNVDDAPTLMVNNGVTLAEGASKTIATSQLRSVDGEQAATGVIYTLTTGPANGTLRNNGAALGVGSTFTQADIDAGRLSYVHDGSETTADSFGFTVGDGSHFSDAKTFALTITPVNDAPQVTRNAGLTVNEGASVTVTPAMLTTIDAEGAPLAYRVTALPINGTFSRNGVALTTGGAFSAADIAAGLITYTHNGGETTGDGIALSVSDGTLSTALTVVVTITPVNDAPVLAGAPASITYTENGTGTTVAPALTITDADSATIASATVSIAANKVAGDTLSFTNQNGISGAYDSATGVLTLVGTSSKANWQTALRSIKFLSTSENPTNAIRTIRIQVDDGQSANSASNQVNVLANVTAVNDTPTVTAGAIAVTQGNVVTLTTSHLSSADPEGAEVTYTVKTATAHGTLLRNGVALGVGGTFTQADVNAGLVRYAHDNSSALSDSFVFTVKDPAGAESAQTTASVSVTAVAGSPPAIATTEGITSAPGDNTATVVDSGLTVTGSGTYSTVKVTISGNWDAAHDALSWDGANHGISGLTGTFDNAKGTLTFIGNGTAAQWQDVLRTVTFKTTSLNTGARTVNFTMGNVVALQINGVYHYYEARTLGSAGWATARDAAAGLSLYGMQGYLATITSEAENSLITSKLNVNAWIGATDSETEGVWKWVTGPEAGQVFYQKSTLTTVTYSNWYSQEPNDSGGAEDCAGIYSTLGNTWNDFNGGATLATVPGYVVEYGGMANDALVTLSASRTVDVVSTSYDVVTTNGSTGAYNHNTATVVDANVTVSSPANVTNARVYIDSGFKNGDTLAYNANLLPAGVTGSYNSTTGVLSFTGIASAAQWQALFRSVTFATNSTTLGDRSVSFTLGDVLSYQVGGSDHYYKYVASPSTTWMAARDAAVAQNHYGLQGYLATITSGGENSFINQKLQATAWIGANDGTVEGTFRWETGPEAGTNVTFADWTSGEPNNGGGSGEDFVAMWQNYGGRWNDFTWSSAIPAGYVVEFGGMAGDPDVHLTGRRTVTVAELAPSIATQSTTTSAGTNNTAAVVDSQLTVTGGRPITSARVSIGSSFVSGSDTLGWDSTLAATLGISGNFSGATGTLSFTSTGTASAADWQELLRTVTFRTNSASTTARQVTFTLGNAVALNINGVNHYYEYVPFQAGETKSWSTAQILAGQKSYYGLTGYLATITSAAENAFINGKLQADAWIGASDSGQENYWKWMTGPEAGTLFFRDDTGTTITYANWGAAQPDNANGTEDYAEIYYSGGVSGKWNDVPDAVSAINGYVVEYGGSNRDPSVQLTASRTININTAPTLFTNVAATVTEGKSVLLSGQNLSVTDAEQTAASLTYTVGTAPAGGQITRNGVTVAAGGTFSQADLDAGLIRYVHGGGEAASDSFTFTVSDGQGGSVGLTTFTVSVSPVNDAPVYANAIAPRTFTGAGSQSFTFAANTFTDAEGDALTYTATLADGSALPSWLSFDTATRTFSGNPPASAEGRTFTVKLTATDTSAASGSGTFTLAIASSNDAPIMALAVPDQAINGGGAWRYQVPAATFSDGDGDALRYTATLSNGDPLPSWLKFDSSTGTFSGNPPASANGQTYNIKVAATDGTASANDTFALSVSSANDAPILSGPIADQSFDGPGTWTFQFAADTFTDPDGDTLTYTATLADGSALPGWLSFDAATRTFSGNPPGGVADLPLKVTASDGNGGSASSTFRLDVNQSGSTNDAPVLTTPIADQTFAATGAWSFTLAGNTFTDADGDTLTYTAKLVDATGALVGDGTLPGWMHFDAATGQFSGNPPNGSAEFHLRVTATDPSGASAQDTFKLSVGAANDAPTAAAIADQTHTGAGAWTFQVPAATFADSDGDALAYTASLQGGGALPAWLSFDPATRTFSGNPPDGEPPVLLRVTASDGKGGTVSSDFTLTVTNGNDAPVVAAPLKDQTFASAGDWVFTVPVNTFVDADGDTLAHSATLANGDPLPSWLNFDESSQTFYGNPPNGVTEVALVVTAVDPSGASASSSFTLSIPDGSANDAPTVTAPGIPDHTWDGSGSHAYQIPAGIFADADGDSLTYSARLANGSALPSWLVFDAATRTFSGNPPDSANGTLTVRVTVTDAANATASDDFVLTIANANDAPQVATAITAQSKSGSGAWTYQVPAEAFTDGDGDTLTLSATGMPSWLSFNAATRTFSGNPPAGEPTAAVTVTATDAAGASVSQSFELRFDGTNDRPTLNNPLADKVLGPGSRSFTLPVNSFADADGDSLTYGAQLVDASGVPVGDGSLPQWLSFDAATRTFSGNPPKGADPVYIKVTAADSSGGTVSDVFSMDITGANDTPTASGPGNQTIAANGDWTYQVPTTTFSDADGDSLTVSAAGMPSWLSFDAATRTFNGNPPASAQGQSWTITLTASDGKGGSVNTSFVLGVDVPGGSNDAPIAGPIPSTTFGGSGNWTYAIPNVFSDPDGDSLSYAATLADGSPLPAWLSFDANSRTFSGNPPADVTALALRVTASDGNGGSSSSDFTLTVTSPNLAPSLDGSAASLPTISEDVTNAAGQTVGALVGGAISDVDASDAKGIAVTGLTGSHGSWQYSLDGGTTWTAVGAVSSGSALLLRDTDKVRFVPDTERGSTPTLVYRAWDRATGIAGDRADASVNGGATAFSAQTGAIGITVTNVNDAPTVANALTGQSKTGAGSWSYQVPAATFADVDGDTLTYSATKTDASALPSWLSFDPVTRTFSGNPPASANGTLNIRVTVTDAAGITASSDFALVVSNANDQPTLGGAAAGLSIDDTQTVAPFTALTIADSDGESLITTVQLDAAAKGSFTAASLSASGFTAQGGGLYRFVGNAAAAQAAIRQLVFQPTANHVVPGQSETTTFTVTTVDGAGATASNTTTTVVTASVNDAPVLGGAVANQALADTAANSPFALFTIADADGAQSQTVEVRLDDAAKGGFTAASLTASGFTSQGEGVYRFTGTAAQAQTAIRQLAFRPTANRAAPGQSETTTMTVAVTDASGATASNSQTTVVVTSANDAPVLSGALVNEPTTDATSVAPFVSLNLTDADTNQSQTVEVQIGDPAKGTFTAESLTASGFTDQGGGLFRFTGTAAEAQWAIRRLEFQPRQNVLPVGTSETTSFTVTVTDAAGAQATDSTTSVVATSVNSEPVLSGSMANQNWTSGSEQSVSFAANLFTDPDAGEVLTYSATLGDGSPLPNWLTFDPATRTFTGTPPDSQGTLDIVVTATDAHGLTVSAGFTLNHAAPVAEQVPVVVQDSKPATEAAAPAPQVRVTEPVEAPPPILGTLNATRTTFAFSEAPLLATISTATTSSSSFSLSGLQGRTFEPVAMSSAVFKVAVADALGGRRVDGIAVQRGMPDQLVMQARIDVAIPADAFVHSDPNAAVHLTATQINGQPLPAWLTFNPETGRFQGIAPTGFNGEVVIKLVARDTNGREAVTVFRFTVVANGQAVPTDGQADGAKAPPEKGKAAKAAAGKTAFTAQLLAQRNVAMAGRQSLIETARRMVAG